MRKTMITMIVALGVTLLGCVDKEAIRKSADDILTKIDAVKAAVVLCKAGEAVHCDNITQAADDVKTDATDIKSKIE